MEKAVETAVEDKVEGGAKSALRQIFGPHPGLALLRFWQGIVELCLAIAVVALSVALLVSACVAISDVTIDTEGATRSVKKMVEDSRSATGFAIFVSLFVMLCELGLVTIRFLNFGVINRFFLPFGVLVVVVVIILAILSFSGAVAAAAQAEDWRQQIQTWEDRGATINSRGQRIPRDLAAAAAFGIFTTLGLATQCVWMILFLVLGWNKNIPTPSIFSGVVKGVKDEIKSTI